MTVERLSVNVIYGCRTTRIYCREDCPAGRRMKLENLVHFRSQEEARASGYRACKICKPDSPHVEPETFFLSRNQSPLGIYTIVSSQRGVVCVEPEDEAETLLARWKQDGIQIQDGGEHNRTVAGEMDAYFSGRLYQFSIPLDSRGTSFQHQVWHLLRDIPYGETRSYGDLARALGRPTAARAEGSAVGSNPVSILVPCHRVIGSNGKLTGYAGGLYRKQALLDLEAAVMRKGAE